MKRSALLIGLFIVSLTAATAQRGFQFGLRGMPQRTAILKGDYPDSVETVDSYGMAFGVAGGYGFSNNLSAYAEVWYSAQGQNLEYTFPNQRLDADGTPLPDNVVTTETRLRYVKVPLYLKYGMNADRKYSFHGILGPQFSFLVDGDFNVDDQRYLENPYIPNLDPRAELSGEPQDPEDVSNLYQQFDFGIMAGAGVDVKLRFNLRMNLQVRTDFSLLDQHNTDFSYDQRLNGVSESVDYWEGQGYSDPARNWNVGLSIGFTYTFIPRFHY